MPPAHGRFNVGIVSLLLSLFLADEEMTVFLDLLRYLVVVWGRSRFVDNLSVL